MQGRTLQAQWAHTAAEFATRIQREHDPRRRQRLQALLQLRRGQRIGEVSETLGVHYRTIQRWVNWYRTDGLDAVLDRTPGYAAPGRRPQLTPEQIQEVLAQLESRQLRSTRDVVEWVEAHHGIRYSMTGMYALLRRARERAPRGRRQDQ